MATKTIHVLSLGAGVQSTALYLMFYHQEMPDQLDAAIFADTQDEPNAVYEHLAWLESLNGPPIIKGTAGKLSRDLVRGRNSTGGRFASIPAFTTPDGGKTVGITRRQCSKEYKTEVIGKVLRREILGLEPGRSPKGVLVHRSCQPLELVELKPVQPTNRATQLLINFAAECEGVCGV